jgi:hypothetical protein
MAVSYNQQHSLATESLLGAVASGRSEAVNAFGSDAPTDASLSIYSMHFVKGQLLESHSMRR